ncbi:MAG: ATP phosphoribosyltransferase regulatory subunit [Lachnospiraceae bacterium]|nr:ATP phosphoribosyltransferase regulatory subunit [Lachnospiraceae bacterium]
MNRVIHTPEGFRDIYGDEFEERRELTDRLSRSLESFGYRGIETPAIEFFDVFSKDKGSTPSKDLYKFFDREGNTMALRPDFTPSVCRCAAAHFSEVKEPLRFTYRGNVYVNSSSYRGRLNESAEVGAEFLFDGSVEADAEIIAAACESLKSCGLCDFKIGIGHADILKGLIEAAGLIDEEDSVRSYIENHNFYGLEQFLQKNNVKHDLSRLFMALQKTFDEFDELSELFTLSEKYPRIHGALERLSVLSDLLKAYGVERFISYDFGFVSRFRYYTGIIFTGYAYGTGEPILSGGRYDHLLENFGTTGEAVGFAVFCDELYSAIKSAGLSLASGAVRRTLTYNEENRKEVIKKAMEMRSTGIEVTLQPEGEK